MGGLTGTERKFSGIEEYFIPVASKVIDVIVKIGVEATVNKPQHGFLQCELQSCLDEDPDFDPSSSQQLCSFFSVASCERSGSSDIDIVEQFPCDIARRVKINSRARAIRITLR